MMSSTLDFDVTPPSGGSCEPTGPTRMVVPGTVVFGRDAIATLPAELDALSVERGLIVCDRAIVGLGIADRIASVLAAGGIGVAVFDGVQPDPPISNVDDCADRIDSEAPDVVIGLGGGSSLDVAKCAVLCADNGVRMSSFDGQLAHARRTALAQVPTTAGSGSEATDRGVFKSGSRKDGYLSKHMVADIACVDPNLMMTVPSEVTATTGMDALTHAIEAYTAPEANTFSDALALAACELIGRHLRRAVYRGDDAGARTAMARAALWAGMAFQNSNLGVVHALALPLGPRYGLSHGETCAGLLPHVMQYNLNSNVGRFARIAAALGEDVKGLSPQGAARKAVDAVGRLSEDVCATPAFSAVSTTDEDRAAIADSAWELQRLIGGNSRRVNASSELEGILAAACG